MAPKRTTTPAPPAASGHLARADRWSGLSAGDPVDVVDARERRAQWTFVAHVTNRETGATWVEVVGGSKGERRVRSFREDQLYPHRSVRAGAPSSPSLADAPALPW